MKSTSRNAAAIVLLLLVASAAAADDRKAYSQRAAAHDAALFDSLDRNADGVVSREESHGDLDFGPRFADMDINRDDNVTRLELQRYIEQRYGVVPQALGQRPSGMNR